MIGDVIPSVFEEDKTVAVKIGDSDIDGLVRIIAQTVGTLFLRLLRHHRPSVWCPVSAVP